MKRLAILGSDSTHTDVYAGLMAREPFRGTLSVTSIWGENSAATHAKAAALGIARVASSPEEAIQNVDGVLVLSRFTEDRAPLARAALDARLPVFVDKCIAEDPRSAQAIVDLAQARGIPLLSCSPYRFAEPVTCAQELVRSGNFSFGVMVGPRECRDLGDDPRFERLNFYGIHSAESVVQVFGDDIAEIRATSSSRGTFALLAFDSGAFCTIGLLSNLPGEAYRLALSGSGGHRDVDFGFNADALYRDSLRAIADQLFGGQTRVRPSSSVAATRIVAAMQEVT